MSQKLEQLTGNEDRLFTFNQMRNEVNTRLNRSFALKTVSSMMARSGITPLFQTASSEATGLYSEGQLDSLCSKIEEGTIGYKRVKKDTVTISREEYERLVAMSEE